MDNFRKSIAVVADRLLNEFKAVLQLMYPRGHFNTRNTHLMLIRLFCDFLAENGVVWIRDIRKGHVLRYIGHLKRLLRDRQIKQTTAINRLNTVNELLRALFHSDRCYVSPLQVFGQRTNVRTKPLVEVTERQAWKAYQALCELGHKSCAIYLMCWWTFGVRYEESLGVDFRRIYAEAKAKGCVRIVEMSKGNAAKHNVRIVKLRAVNERVLHVLEMAADQQGERRNLILPNMSLLRFERVIRKQYEKVRRAMKLPSPKEYRAGYACWFYQSETRNEAPLVSGKWDVQKTVDRKVRGEISRALGHRRISVTSAYLGGMRRPVWKSASTMHEASKVGPPAEIINSAQEKLYPESTDQMREPHPSVLEALARQYSELDQGHMRVRIDMENLLAVRISGTKAVRSANICIGRSIAMEIYSRYKVRPREYQLKHFLWYVENVMPSLGRAAAERHFVVLSIIMLKTGKVKYWARPLELSIKRTCESYEWPVIERIVWLRNRETID